MNLCFPVQVPEPISSETNEQEDHIIPILSPTPSTSHSSSKHQSTGIENSNTVQTSGNHRYLGRERRKPPERFIEVC